jgi:hypothetical protein
MATAVVSDASQKRKRDADEAAARDNKRPPSNNEAATSEIKKPTPDDESSAPTMDYYKAIVAATPKRTVVAKWLPEDMQKFGIPREDPKREMSLLNLYTVETELEHEMKVRAAFAQMRRDVAAGKKVPSTNPYEASWRLHSSQYYGEWLVDEIDITDWHHELEGRTWLSFESGDDFPPHVHADWVSLYPAFKGVACVRGYSELKYGVSLSSAPAGSTAELIEVGDIIEARGPVSIWFAGDGYLKLEVELRTEGKKPLVCSFWGIQELYRKRRSAS